MTFKAPNSMVVNSLRATEREWQAWDVAARLVRLTRSEWMRHVLARAAEETIAQASQNKQRDERKKNGS